MSDDTTLQKLQLHPKKGGTTEGVPCTEQVGMTCPPVHPWIYYAHALKGHMKYITLIVVFISRIWTC